MILECRNPAIIIEGQGDKDALPHLIRNLLNYHEIYDFTILPHPITKQNIPKLRRPGDLEKFLKYGLSKDGDSILVILDCDKLCAKDEVSQFTQRAMVLDGNKKIGFSFFNSEYESLFIACLDEIAEKYPEYGWNLDDWDILQDHEGIVGAKGYLTRHMKYGRAYKETREDL